MNSRLRRGFTLTELLITISIIALLAGLGLAALGGATEMAREQRTGSMIDKIDALIRERYEEYRTRAVPIKMPAGGTPRFNGQIRLFALRALMRMELPDRRTDIVNFTTSPPTLELPGATTTVTLGSFGLTQAALQKSYFRMAVKALGGRPNDSSTWATALGKWTAEHEGAECLYLIIASMRDGDKSALDYFSTDEISDVDEDGMKEIIDGWGTPITFLRWAPGYCEQKGADGYWGRVSIDDDNNGTTDDFSEWNYPGSDDGVSLVPTMQTRNYLAAPDPFDPARVDARWSPTLNLAQKPYALHPLILSAGPDRIYDIQLSLGSSFRYAVPPTGLPAYANFPNDPYFDPATANMTEPQLGTPIDPDGDGQSSFSDNITNHAQQAP